MVEVNGTGTVRVDVVPGYGVRYSPARGRVYVPGVLGYFRAFDPIQASLLLDYAGRRLGWLFERKLLPHQCGLGWESIPASPFSPPWDPGP